LRFAGVLILTVIPNQASCPANAGHLAGNPPDKVDGISKVEWTGDGSTQAPNETFELSFAEFQLNYKVQQDQGDAAAGMASFGFHIQKSKRLSVPFDAVTLTICGLGKGLQVN
jgi:hypothetical protein